MSAWERVATSLSLLIRSGVAGITAHLSLTASERGDTFNAWLCGFSTVALMVSVLMTLLCRRSR